VRLSLLRSPRPSSFARFGRGSWLVPPCTVTGGGSIEIGDDVWVMELAAIECTGRLSIAGGCRFGRALHISCPSEVEIEEAVSGSDHVAILDATVVESGAYLGYGSVVGPGVRVGRGAYVGEGAVVVDDVPAHAVVFGNPAVVVRA
jgi:acetyltransferase-like isoleucine patch superfamily enzyme